MRESLGAEPLLRHWDTPDERGCPHQPCDVSQCAPRPNTRRIAPSPPCCAISPWPERRGRHKVELRPLERSVGVFTCRVDGRLSEKHRRLLSQVRRRVMREVVGVLGRRNNLAQQRIPSVCSWSLPFHPHWYATSLLPTLTLDRLRSAGELVFQCHQLFPLLRPPCPPLLITSSSCHTFFCSCLYLS